MIDVQVLVFDLKAPLAHFRRPDTTATHVTYPFITRTALRGLIGSILGMDEFHGEAWTGVQLCSPVRTVSQELSLLGKKFLGGSGDTFNRPTAIELVVKPHYRIYYAGEHMSALSERIKNKRSHYHTYLGSAFALTVPEYVGLKNVEPLPLSDELGEMRAITVVPAHIMEQLGVVAGVQYGRAGGIHYEHLGNRRFRGGMHFIYEVSGQAIHFTPKASPVQPPVQLARLDNDEVVCLW